MFWLDIKRECVGVLAACAVFGAGPVWAQWPDKAIRIVVTSPPGGTPDVLARLLGEQLSRNLKQPVVVESKAGASGTIAVQALLSAPADGLTLMIAPNGALTEVPHVTRVGFDPLKDVKQVAELTHTSLVMVANAAVPPDTLQEFITYAKAESGKLSFASFSSGSRSHFAGLILNEKAGIDMNHVPYRGGPQAAVDVLAGQVPLMFDALPNSLRNIRAGKLKAYAVAGPTRSEHLPQTPTFAELGYPDITFSGWIGVYASGRTSPQLMATMHDAIVAAFAAPEVRQRVTDAGFEAPLPSPLDQQDVVMRREFERNAAIVKAYDIKTE